MQTETAERQNLSRQLADAIPALIAVEDLCELSRQRMLLPVLEYEEQVLRPPLQAGRMPVRKIVQSLSQKVLRESESGPLLTAEVIWTADGLPARTLGIIAQNREQGQGVWSPEHHDRAADAAVDFASRGLPIVTFIDTPGADAGEAANLGNQAHHISRLIAVMSQLKVPSVGIVLGTAYSGGAIPLAATSYLFSVRDGLFSTIQPQGLASIARKQRLSWQACARQVGVTAADNVVNGWIDGVIDYSPADQRSGIKRILRTVLAAIDLVETDASQATRRQPELFEAYRAMVELYQQSPERLEGIENNFFAGPPQCQPNLFNLAIRNERYERLRHRLRHTTVAEFEQLAEPNRARDVRPAVESSRAVLDDWLEKREKLIYEERLMTRFRQFHRAATEQHADRSALVSLVLGRPKDNYRESVHALCFEIGLYLYNRWKASASAGFESLYRLLSRERPLQSVEDLPEPSEVTLNHLLEQEALQNHLKMICRQMRLFDALYDGVLQELVIVAREASSHRSLSQHSVARLLEAALEHARSDRTMLGESAFNFSVWLKELMQYRDLDTFLRQVAEWKQHQHARLSETLFVLISCLFERVFPSYLAATNGEGEFDGRLNPAWIGRRKDFWHRLSFAYCDLQIQALQREYRTHWPDWQGWIDELCSDFEQIAADWISEDPCQFPAYRDAMIRHMDAGQPAVGMITGIARFKRSDRSAGLMLSNVRFQAGALDMAGAARMLALIEHCGRERLPLVGLISSGGMQTKEGAGSLFAMAAVNEAITRFRQTTGLPVIMIGFGDCTGGAQASFVTHPLVETWYISGTNMPFAGQIVVPSYLPSVSTLANYLGRHPGTMHGLLSHPFADSFDSRLLEIDPELRAPDCSLQDMLFSRLGDAGPVNRVEVQPQQVDKRFAPVRKVLLHARGCTAVKLLRDTQALGIPVVLVQSDPDMKSLPAHSLGPQDELVCIGGNTPDESYLNANSVLHVASMTGADALHPGIGFLSEDPDFAKRCQVRGLNFVGPDYRAMVRMGDKSIALTTAIEAGVPVVPGSHGVLDDLQDARDQAKRIGFPLLLKAAFGGGGKGIALVERAEDLNETFTRLRREAKAAFGRSSLYMERFVARMRHIEVQVLRDRHGHCILPGIRDCSVQRNNQKLLEESASTLLSEELKKSALVYAERIAAQVDYIGAGTVEFIYDLDHQSLYFMEMNTRLQVEHPVTEKVSGLSIPALQYAIAAGDSIDQVRWQDHGYSIEARVNAERVIAMAEGFRCDPSPGLVRNLVLPEIEGLDVISCIDSAYRVEPFYDSLVMQVVAHGKDRAEAIDRLERFLSALQIDGIATNAALLAAILRDEVFRGGDFDTGFLNGFRKRFDTAVLQSAESRQPDLDIHVAGTNELKVLCPATSIFYRSSSPLDPPFVSEGDLIGPEQTLGLLEAMKAFTPLRLGQIQFNGQSVYDMATRYRVNRVLVDDGQQVNTGDLLLVIEPCAEAAEQAAPSATAAATPAPAVSAIPRT